MQTPQQQDRASSQLPRQIEQAAREVEAQCTFAAFRRRQAILQSLGTTLAILAFAAMHFGALVTTSFGADGAVVGGFLDKLLTIITKEFVETDYAQTHVVSMVLFFALLVAAFFVLQKAKEEDAAFRAAHPFFNRRADPARLSAARAIGRRFIAVGFALLVCGLGVHLLTLGIAPPSAHDADALFIDSGVPAYEVADGVILVFTALGVGLVMYGNRVTAAPNYELYNLRTLARRSVYDIARMNDERLRSVLLVVKRSLSRAVAIGHGVLGVAVFVAVCMFFLPSLESPWWWVPLLGGFVLRDVIESTNVVRLHRRYGALLVDDGTE